MKMTVTKINDFLIDSCIPETTIMIVDTYNMVYRNFYAAYWEFKQHKDKYQQGIENEEYTEDMLFEYWKHLFLNSLFSEIRRVNPDKLIMALEGKENWRKDIYQLYKANRHHDNVEINWEDFKNKMLQFMETLSKLFTNIYFLTISKIEADDIIAVLTKELCKKNKIEIISSDSDLYQLQNKNVKQYNPIKKEYAISINPKMDLEIKILTGDKSDNISGIFYGCGPKTAKEIINEGIDEYIIKKIEKKSKRILNSEEIYKIYERNKKLIDFNYIPSEYQEKILYEYKNYNIQKINPMLIYNYFSETELNIQLDNWQLNFSYIKKLN